MVDFLMPCIQLFCCSCRIPKSSPNEYYFDPKFITNGQLVFSPEKIQNRFSVNDFISLRQEMMSTAGEEIRKAKIAYRILRVFVVLCFFVWVGQIVFAILDPDEYKDKKLPMIASILVTAIPNTALHCFWKSYTKKSCEKLNKLFALKNKGVFAPQGVHWKTCKTLRYLKVKLVRKENQLADGQSADQPSQFLGQDVQMGQPVESRHLNIRTVQLVPNNYDGKNGMIGQQVPQNYDSDNRVVIQQAPNYYDNNNNRVGTYYSQNYRQVRPQRPAAVLPL